MRVSKLCAGGEGGGRVLLLLPVLCVCVCALTPVEFVLYGVICYRYGPFCKEFSARGLNSGSGIHVRALRN